MIIIYGGVIVFVVIIIRGLNVFEINIEVVVCNFILIIFGKKIFYFFEWMVVIIEFFLIILIV